MKGIESLRRGARRRWIAVLPLLTLPLMGVDRGCVTKPLTDTLVTSSAVEVRGAIGRYDDVTMDWVENVAGSARLRVNGGAYLPWQATNADKVWIYPSVGLPIGVNKLDGQTSRWTGFSFINGTIDPFILERRTDLASAGTQQVFLDWSDAATSAKLKAIATGTLSAPLTAAQQDAFVADVKAKVASFFANAYSSTSITVVNAMAPGVHRVKFHGYDSCALYGQSPGDFKNTVKGQTSDIYIGTFKCVMVDYGELIASTPAALTDSLSTRATDVATAIGRTAAHEVGHSLGLTADGALLHGCEGWHNCEAYDDANPSDRFDTGHHIMDPGPKSPMYARIGQASASVRKNKRPYFEAYGKSYLKIIHP